MSKTSGIVTSAEGARVLVSEGLSFPILVIPVSERSGVTNHIVQNIGQLLEAIKEALKDSNLCFPAQAHVISRAGWVPSGYWLQYRTFKSAQI